MNTAASSSSNSQRVFRLFAPHARSRNFLIAAVLIPGLVMACLLTLFITAGPSESGMSNTDAFLFFLGMVLLPMSAIILAVAALREPHHPPRAIMWFVASFFIFLAGVTVSFMMIQDSSLERAVALTFLLIVIAPVALLFSLPAMYSATRAVPEIRAVLIDVTSERALAFITSRRALTLPDLGLLAGIPLGETDNIVDDLLRSGRLAGSLDPSTGWIYTSAYLADQQSQLLAWINLRGHITIEELAQLLRVSSVVTLDWIYQLVQRRQFAGYVNWKTRTLYAEAARKIGVNSQCPECGGALVPASAQRIVCQSCGTEMFGRRIKLTSP